MGLYDEVAISCPSCGKPNYLQSKGGDCRMRVYGLEDCPLDVLSGLDETFYCDHCGKILKIVSNVVVKKEITVEEDK